MQPTLKYVTLLSSGIQRAASKQPADRSLDLLFDEMVQEAVEDGLSQDLTKKLDRIANGFKSGKLTLPQALDDAYQALKDGVDDDALSLDEDSDEAGDDLLLGSAGVLGALGAIAQQAAAEAKLDNNELESALNTGYHAAAQTSVVVASARWAGRTDVASMRQTLMDRIARQVHSEGSKILDKVRDGSTSLAQGQAQFRTALHNAVWYNEASAANDFARNAGMSFAWWETDSPVGKEYPCDDCSVREEESPYSLDELPGLPGDGSTQCGPGCLCTVRYSNSDVERQLRRLYRRARCRRIERFNPDEERDERGRWTDGGSNAVDTREIGQWGSDKLTEERAQNAPGLLHKEGSSGSDPWGGLNQPVTNTANATVNGRALMDDIIASHPDILETGMQWYAKANDYGNELAAKYGMSKEAAYATIAALSPQTEWGLNQRLADQVCAIATDRVGQTITFTKDDLKDSTGKPIALTDITGKAIKFAGDANGRMTIDVHQLSMKVQASINPDLKGQSADNLIKALDLARGANPDERIGGSKVRSFYNSILTRGEGNYPCIDTHMIRALSGDHSLYIKGDHAGNIMGNPATYDILANAVRNLTNEYQTRVPGMTPEKMQATLWTRWLQLHGPQPGTRARANPTFDPGTKPSGKARAGRSK